MNAMGCVLAVLLGALPLVGRAEEPGRADERMTLEALRRCVARNERLIDPIKLSYTVKFSRRGDRPQQTRGRRPGRSYSHQSGVWAQSGPRQYVQLDYFYGPDELANSSLTVFDDRTKTSVRLPDRMSCTIGARDARDWFDAFGAKLRLRPFESHYLLSELLVPPYATIHPATESVDGRPTCVVDLIPPDVGSSPIRLWIDAEAAIPLRARAYDRHPTVPQARLVLEVNDVTPHRLPNGGWIPITGVRALHFAGDSPHSSYEHIVVDVNSIATEVPDSLFHIETPDGACIYNDISGLTTVQGRLAKSYEQIVQGGATFIGGAVTDSDGRPIPQVVVAAVHRKDVNSIRLLQSHERVCAITDAQGRFALALETPGASGPVFYRLAFYSADFADHAVHDVPLGEHDVRVSLEKGGTVTGRAFRAMGGKRQPLSGVEVVAHAGDAPVAGGMWYGRTRTITDAQGRFEIGHLPVRTRDRSVPRSEPPRYVPLFWMVQCGGAIQSLSFEDDDDRREVELVLKPDVRVTPSLVGRPMPTLDGLGLNVDPEQLQGRRLLICFFDIEQRPARNCVEQLARRSGSLNDRGVTVLAVHEKGIDLGKLAAWAAEARVTCPVGIIVADPADVKFAWSVRSLPWLILADSEHVVRAEGIDLDELDRRIEAAK